MRTDLAALVGSRICHDLISPIGAIGNGVELLTMSGPQASSPELDLISQSVHNANARIGFFRIAYGTAASDQMLGRQEILAVLAATAQGGRFTYYWQVEGDQSRTRVRTAFLLLQCFETALPLGGEIQIAQDGDDWVLTGTGSRLVVDADLWAGLTDPALDVAHKASQVQFALVPSAIAQSDSTLQVSNTDDTITARF